MGDDQQSAGELSKRYARNGTAKDDELTASQLRSRHGIPKNSGGEIFMISCDLFLSFNAMTHLHLLSLHRLRGC